MSISNDRVTYLFNRYFEKSATPPETEELFKLLNLSATDEQLTQLLRQAWNNYQAEHPFFEPAKSQDILNAILQTGNETEVFEMAEVRTVSLWRRYAAAAAVLILAGLGIYFVIKPKPQSPIIAQTKQHDVLPGGNKAILTLANGKTIVLDSAHNGVIAKQGNSIINKTQNGQLVYNAANTGAEEANQINTVATPRGGQYQVVLPDGTKVWLNAASSIKYPTVFSGNTRKVEMTGEVYFEVAKNAQKPFIVKASRAEIEVLGTHFNIMAYNEEAAMKTTLLEGSIKIATNNASKVIKPGQQAILDENNALSVVENVDLDDVVAWKNGLFQYSDADIKTIMREAARWYDVDVIYQGNVPVKQYNGRISRNVKASALMNMLRFTGVNSRIEGRNIYIVNQ